jgi:hypothetical protein
MVQMKNWRSAIAAYASDQLHSLDALLKDYQGKLAEAENDAQLAWLALQGALEREAKTVQTLSNISKKLHDTATAVIRNIK